MNLNLFKTYIKVVETKNLSRTADEFGISQPAVTKQIQTLEDIYGVLLLERAGRRLKTTEAGKTLYYCAKEIIKAVEKAEKAMGEVARGRKEYLVLGASTIPGQYILPYLLKEFKEQYSDIPISIDIADTEKIFNRVADRELDIGIVGGWVNNRKVEGFKWLEDELVVIVPEKHEFAGLDEINIRDLANERWIFRKKGSGTRKAAEELLETHEIKKEKLNVCIETGSTEAVLAAVESGMGISVVSSWAIRSIAPFRKISSIKISSSAAKRFIYVIYPRQKARRKPVVQFMDFLKKAGTAEAEYATAFKGTEN